MHARRLALLACLFLAGCFGATDPNAGATGSSSGDDSGTTAPLTDADGASDSSPESPAETGAEDVGAGRAETAGREATALRADGGRPPPGGVSGGRDIERETLVVLEPLSRGPIRDEIVVSARVESRVAVSVFPKLSGLPVTQVIVEEGDQVAAGQILMRLYDDDLRLTVQERESLHQQSLKEIDRAQIQLEEDGAKIVRAERQAEKAAGDHARLAGLLEQQLVNQQETDDARLAADTALDDLALARKTRDRSKVSLELARISAQQSELQHERALADLAHTVVRSPLDGVVASRAIDIGELSGAAERAFQIVDLTQPLLNLRVPQDSLARLAAGQRVEAAAVTLGGKIFEGTVRSVNPVLDEVTGSVRVIVDLEPAPDLHPGLFCSARVITSARDDALLVDKRAVQHVDELPHVFVLDEDGEHVRKLSFRPGASTPLMTEILGDAEGEPLPQGLRVVVVGQESLKDGGRVRVQETAY